MISYADSNTQLENRAILDLKNQRDKIHQYQKRMTILTDRETAIAKECLARNDRRRALLALRRKKYQESLLAKTGAQLEQLEQLVNRVEFALVQKDVLFGLQQGTKVLQEIQKEMGGLESVEKLMGETEEARAYQEVSLMMMGHVRPNADMMVAMQEVSQMLAGRMSNQDEDEVEDELEALEREVRGPVSLPDAPTTTISEETEKEKEQKAKARAKARAKERAAVPMAA